MPDELEDTSSADLVAGLSLPPEMLGDIQAVAAVDIDAADKFIQALKREEGVLTEGLLENLSKRFFDDDAAESVVRTMQIVPPESKDKFLTLIDRWRQASPEQRLLIPDDIFAALRRNLDSLLQDYSGLDLMHKAQRLLRDTGNEIRDAIFICDLRPVFDKPQERVEGFVALANLRIRYLRQSGLRDVFEIALTEEELSALVKHGEKALKKLSVLKDTVDRLIV